MRDIPVHVRKYQYQIPNILVTQVKPANPANPANRTVLMNDSDCHCHCHCVSDMDFVPRRVTSAVMTSSAPPDAGGDGAAPALSLLALPDELLGAIVSYLDARSLRAAACACRALARRADERYARRGRGGWRQLLQPLQLRASAQRP